MKRPGQRLRPGFARAMLAAFLVGGLAPAVPATAVQSGAAEAVYFPGAGDDWERRRPDELGMSAARLQQAVDFALEHETAGTRELREWIAVSFAGEPFNEIIGPTKSRGDPNGLVIRSGYIVAEWGDTHRVDMTFSVTKSFLTTVAGLAWDRGLIRDVHDPVRGYVPTDHFEDPHNAPVTWDHLLRQTSGWEGTLWGKPDWADRFTGERRPRQAPGEAWQYNDVRVNLLALSLLHVWRRPLPQVLREEVMQPIGASNTWRWRGYRNSWVVMDGLRVESVSGGGHWGGGMFISARDLARFGYLTLREGRWRDRQILSPEFLRLAATPTQQNPRYGFMNFFLNRDGGLVAGAPASSFYHAGAGSNIVYVDPVNDLVVVVRWIERRHLEEFLGRVLAALEPAATD